MNAPFRCPVAPDHGKLLDWPTERWAWHCPSQEHDPFRDRPASRAFFTTTEAETGQIAPPRSAPVIPAPLAPPELGRPRKGEPDRARSKAEQLA